MIETIVAAALLVGDEVWTLPAPARHHHLHRAWMSVHRSTHTRVPTHSQGFVTNAGRFVGREEAARIARVANQIKATKSTNPQHELFSEDLW